MKPDLYEKLESRLGPAGAKQAILSHRSIIPLCIIGLAGFIYAWSGIPSQAILNIWMALTVVAFGFFVSTRIKLASIVSDYLGMKVHWYEIPSANQIRNLDRWLDKKAAQRKP